MRDTTTISLAVGLGVCIGASLGNSYAKRRIAQLQDDRPLLIVEDIGIIEPLE